MRKLSTDLIKSGSFTGSFSGSVTGLINSASYALTASTVLNAFSLTTGSTYSITASWSNYSIGEAPVAGWSCSLYGMAGNGLKWLFSTMLAPHLAGMSRRSNRITRLKGWDVP